MKHILSDPWAYISTVMIIAVQWVIAHVNVFVGIAMAIGGIVTLLYRIKADRKKNQILDIEIKIKQEQLRQEQAKSK